MGSVDGDVVDVVLMLFGNIFDGYFGHLRHGGQYYIFKQSNKMGTIILILSYLIILFSILIDCKQLTRGQQTNHLDKTQQHLNHFSIRP